MITELLERIDRERARQSTWEADHPAQARETRRYQERDGGVCVFDDPVLTLRCSLLEQLCRQALGLPPEQPADPPTLFSDTENT